MNSKAPLLLGLALCCSAEAYADEYHYNNLLVGGEAIGMAGAYTALSEDLSCLHYNPAGMMFAKTENTASVNTLAWEQTSFNQVFGDGSDFDRDSFAIIPGFIGVKKDFDHWVFGISFAVTDYSKERSNSDAIYQPEAELNTEVNEYAHINIDNSVYLLKFAGATFLNPKLSLGFGVGVEYQEFETVQGSGTSISTDSTGTEFLSGFDAERRFDDVSINLEPGMSLLWKQNGWSLGGRLSRKFSVSRTYESTNSIVVTQPLMVPGTFVNSSRETTSSTHTRQYPWQLSVGGAYRYGDFSLSFDLSNYSRVKDKNVKTDDLGAPITRELGAVTNWATGVKYHVSDHFDLAFGIFTDNSNGRINPSIDFERVEDIDLKGYSLALEFEDLTLGAYYKRGSGQVRIADIRVVEQVVGIPLYRPSDNHDVVSASKDALVVYLSLNF